jgi:hypothetical protein
MGDVLALAERLAFREPLEDRSARGVEAGEHLDVFEQGGVPLLQDAVERRLAGALVAGDRVPLIGHERPERVGFNEVVLEGLVVLGHRGAPD